MLSPTILKLKLLSELHHYVIEASQRLASKANQLHREQPGPEPKVGAAARADSIPNRIGIRETIRETLSLAASRQVTQQAATATVTATVKGLVMPAAGQDMSRGPQVLRTTVWPPATELNVTFTCNLGILIPRICQLT